MKSAKPKKSRVPTKKVRPLTGDELVARHIAEVERLARTMTFEERVHLHELACAAYVAAEEREMEGLKRTFENLAAKRAAREAAAQQ